MTQEILENEGRIPWVMQGVAAFRQDKRIFISENVNSGQGNLTDSWLSGGEGFSNVNISSIRRITFANDTNTATVRGNLNVARKGGMATGNTTDGWVIGGAIDGSPSSIFFSTVDRIIFANDTTLAQLRNSTPGAVADSGVVQNSISCWFFSGANGQTVNNNVYRMDFFSDTLLSPRRSLENIMVSASGTGNSTDGWFCGGEIFTTQFFASTSIYRINYATDDIVLPERGSLSIAQFGGSASGNQTDGWVFGGSVQNTNFEFTSNVQRVIFANDTILAGLRGPLPRYIFLNSSTSNTTDAWVYGLINSETTSLSGPVLSNHFRVTFANDTATAQVRGAQPIETFSQMQH